MGYETCDGGLQVAIAEAETAARPRRAGRSGQVIRHWKTVAIVMAVTVLVLSVVAVAYGATAKTRGAAGNGACGALTDDPKAIEAMQELRTEHQTEMRAWSDLYGSNPSSAEAQVALQKLREEHRNDMRDLFGKLGIEVPDGAGAGGGMMRGAGGCGGACGGDGNGAVPRAEGAGYGMMGDWSY